MPRLNRLTPLLSLGFVATVALLFSSLAIAHQRHYRYSHIDRRSVRRETALASRSIMFRRETTSRIVTSTVASPIQPMHEVRAMWVVRDSMETPEKIRHIVMTAKQFGYNTLFVQVRGRGDAWYKSTLEPRAEELANQPDSFDPLQTIIDDAHADGIQVHAWLNTCYVWSAGRKPMDSSHIVNAHPDWLARTSDGNYRLTYSDNCEGAFLSPANADVRQHLHDVFLEVAKNYDIDGIHIDYIRYPNHNYDYSPSTVSSFIDTVRPTISDERCAVLNSEGDAAYLHAFPDRWADFRRDQVTSLVEWISKDVKAAKPWVVVSAAVFADWTDAYNERGQDWKRWLRDGALDAVVPMAYSSSTAVVATEIRDAESTASQYGRVCYAGVGSWHISAASTKEKIIAARAAGAQGIVLFSYGGVTQYGQSNNYLAKLNAFVFNTPATLPMLKSIGERTSVPNISTGVFSNPAASASPIPLVPAS